MNCLQISDLVFAYPKSAALFRIPRLEVKAGERLFIQGASGSGKSTLLSLIAGIRTAPEGEIQILGQNWKELSSGKRDKFRADHLGFIFQLFNLIPYLSVIENIELTGLFSSKRLQAARKAESSLSGEAKYLLESLELPARFWNKKISELSVGQCQRVAAARALWGSPQMVIADEPTSALDENLKLKFMRLMMKECESRNVALIFVSHDSTLESLFDKSIKMTDYQPHLPSPT